MGDWPAPGDGRARESLTERGKAALIQEVEGIRWDYRWFSKEWLDTALEEIAERWLRDPEQPHITEDFAAYAASFGASTIEVRAHFLQEAEPYMRVFWINPADAPEVPLPELQEWFEDAIARTLAGVRPDEPLESKIDWLLRSSGVEHRASSYLPPKLGIIWSIRDTVEAALREARAEQWKSSIRGGDGGMTEDAVGARAVVAKALAEKMASYVYLCASRKSRTSHLTERLKEWLVSEGYLSRRKPLLQPLSKLLSELGYQCPVGEYYVKERPRFNELYSAEVAATGFDVKAVVGRKYRVGAKAGSRAIKPREMRQECIEDYLDYCEQKADPGKEKQKRRVEFARRVFARDPGLVIEEYLPCLSKPQRARLEALLATNNGEHIAFAGLVQDDAEILQALEGAAFDELRLLLQSKKTDSRRESLETVLERFEPEVYEEIFEQAAAERRGRVFELEVTRNPHLVKRSAKATSGSCIADNNRNYFERVTSDPGTLFLAARQNGRLRGYARLFLMRESGGEPVLAVDTLEPPHKDFENHIGLVNAMALAAVQLGLDIGAKYIVAEDARIKYGPRQAFGNKQKDMHLTKLGSHDVTVYCFGTRCDSSPYVLMESWK